jgi:peptide/nickel transport system ATP-binding protein
VAGESGSGKSVSSLAILRLLAGTAKFVSGEILFSSDGLRQVDILQLQEKDLRSIRGKQIAMIFQEPMTSLNPVFSCGHQVMEAILQHEKISSREAKRKTIELFENVKLPDSVNIFNRYPHQLSGGQKQRVMIAMAMSCNPSLLICDEPTTALDVTVQKTILELIKELQASTGMGVMFITHDLGVISQFADRVVVMFKGEIIEEGPVSKIFSVPDHAYTRKLLDVSQRLKQKNPSTQIGNNDVLIKVENLSVWYPSKKSFLGKPLDYTRAVDDVSFEVYRG